MSRTIHTSKEAGKRDATVPAWSPAGGPGQVLPHGRRLCAAWLTQRRMKMAISKEELIGQIEQARRVLNESIDLNEEYDIIYHNSIALDKLIEEYIVSGY